MATRILGYCVFVIGVIIQDRGFTTHDCHAVRLPDSVGWVVSFLLPELVNCVVDGASYLVTDLSELLAEGESSSALVPVLVPLTPIHLISWIEGDRKVQWEASNQRSWAGHHITGINLLNLCNYWLSLNILLQIIIVIFSRIHCLINKIKYLPWMFSSFHNILLSIYKVNVNFSIDPETSMLLRVGKKQFVIILINYCLDDENTGQFQPFILNLSRKTHDWLPQFPSSNEL